MPDDRFVFSFKAVEQIGKLQSTWTYNLSEMNILSAAGFKLNEVNFQPLKNLKKIVINGLSDEFFERVPQAVDLDIFKNLNNIKSLTISSYEITNVENTANECILPKLYKLSFRFNKLTTFDLGVIRCAKNLEVLDLSNNQIATIQNSSPDGACMWPDLRIIWLSSNKLIHFEPSFFSCSSKLSTLMIFNNQLTSFGVKQTTCYWPNLTFLDVSRNELTSFDFQQFLINHRL